MGHTECVRLLLHKGADVEATAQGKTALQLARERGHTEAARVLEEATSRRHDEQAAALVARQSEATLLATDADASQRRGLELAEAVLTARRAPSRKQPVYTCVCVCICARAAASTRLAG